MLRNLHETPTSSVSSHALRGIGIALSAAVLLLTANAIAKTNAPATAHRNLERSNQVLMIGAKPVQPLSQRDCLIRLAYHEARSETEQSIVKRVWTAVWRARRDDFKASTICEAVFQYGAFSAFLHGLPPMKDKVALARVSRIVDEQMPAILPDLYKGTECVETDMYTGKCVYTLADTIKKQPVMTHHAEADCYYLGRKGYDYIRRLGRCEPRWAAKMTEISSAKCSVVKKRRCRTVFWLVGGK